MITTQKSWIAASQQFLGKPWRESGFECYDLVREMYRAVLGVELPAMPQGPSLSKNKQFKKMMDEYHGKWVSVDEPQPGTVVALSRFQLPHHCGIYIGQQFIAHVFEARHGVLLSRPQQLAAQGWNIVGYYNWAAS